MTDELIPERPSARLLIQDPARSAFLFLRVNDPHLSAQVSEGCACWVTLGGGVEASETFEQTAVRELWEEAGLVAGRDATIGGIVGERRKVFPFGTGAEQRQMLSIEMYFAVTLLVSPDVVCDTNLQPYERSFITSYAWWTSAEIRAAIAAGTDAFFPGDIADYLARI